LIDILEAWKNLLFVLRKEMVFTQYLPNLERAFRAVSVTSALYGRAIHTLLDLLTQAALEHSRDRSIECRFVTLLEIVLSYDNPRWEPSDDICAIWIRLLQRIPPCIAPTNFRRKAYRVLVSLSWVPSSKGLLAACSFDESKQLPTFQKKGIIAHMSKIRGGPLPRYDSVNQLLDRLKDETGVCVAIPSENGVLVKTTLAGQVASHPSILRVFTVLWLDIKQETLTYDRYICYLKDLCEQIGCPNQDWPMSEKRFEEPAILKLRETGYMKDAKSLMSDLSVKLDSNILLVLDDVRDSSTLDWFRFSDQQSIIVTTPHSNLDGVDWTLDLLPLSEEESAELFLKESGLSPDHIIGKTKEVRSIVHYCSCHPLTVRTMSRWYLLKQITAGLTLSVEEILDDLNALATAKSDDTFEAALEDDPNELIFDILSLMMGPIIRMKEPETQSVLFVLCFAAMVVVFGDVAPLDAVILLWEQVLRKEVLATDELEGTLSADDISRCIWLVAQGLTHMGVIAIVDVDGWHVVQVHHDIYKDFGVLIAKEMEVKETFQRTTSDWHKYFVTGYLSRKSQGIKENHDNTWKYAVEKLPSHILDGKMISTANIVLSQEQFFYARIKALGWQRAIEVQIRDCVRLQHEIENDFDGGDQETMASIVFKRTATLVQESKDVFSFRNEEERCEAIVTALYLIGFALTENGYFQDALECLAMAETIPHMSQTLQTKIVYATCWSLLAVSQTQVARRKIEGCQMSTSRENHWLKKEMFQLKAAILIGSCNYQSAKALLQDFLKVLNDDKDNNVIELGMTLEKLGRLQFVMGDNDLASDTLTDCVHKKKEIAETSRAFSSALNLLGDISVELGSMNEAREHYTSAILMLKALHYDNHHLDWRFITGKLQFIQGDIASCLESFELVRRTSNSTPLKVFDQSAYDLRFIARAYDELGDTTESISVLHESLFLTEDRPSSLERAWGLIALGHCHVKCGNNKDALVYFEQGREIQKK
jgi:tetratricopeptide (TPR) repeat protein